MNGKDYPVTSYISLYPPRTIFLDYSYILKKWTQIGPTFSSFSNLPTSKKTGPEGRKMRMDHPFILGFCQNVTFDIVFTRICHFSGKNQHS